MKSQNILKIGQFLNCTKPLLEYEGKNERDCHLTMHVRLDMRIFQRTIFKRVCFLLSVAATLASYCTIFWPCLLIAPAGISPRRRNPEEAQ